MRILNGLVALALVVVLGFGLYMGWQFYSDCQNNGVTNLRVCVFGPSVVDPIIETVDDVVDDVKETVDDVGEFVSSESCKAQFGDDAVQHADGNCYVCQEGYVLSAIGVIDASSPEACGPPGLEQVSKATFVGSSNCSPNSFLDPRNGGECWTCPTDYVRTVFAVTENNACEKLIRQAATNHGQETGIFGTDCGTGQFWDPNGNCYSCPQGFSRTVFAVTSNEACEKLDQQTAKFEGPGGLSCPAGAFHDPRNGGECWSCPEGFNRSSAPVTADNACSRSNTLDLIPAINYGPPDP